MFGRDATDRIDDTLDYIKKQNAVLDDIARTEIENLVKQQYPKTTPQEKQAFKSLSGNMSVAKHIGTGVPKGDEAQRHQRRAIFLLWTAIGKKTGSSLIGDPKAKAAMTMQPAALAKELQTTMIKAAAVASIPGVRVVFDYLQNHTLDFFQDLRIVINGSKHGKDQFQAGTGPHGGKGPFTNVFPFFFSYEITQDSFVITYTAPNTTVSHSFRAISVPALQWNEVPGVGTVATSANFGNILGTELTGASVMVTTQFTGCSFCYKTDDTGQLFAAHISPGLQYVGGGSALADSIMLTGQMPNAVGTGTLNVFGSGSGNANVPSGESYYPAGKNRKHMTIIGFDITGNWKMFTQSLVVPGTITEVRQII